MAALKVESTPEAQRDLLLIAWRSRQVWGESQAERYRRRLQSACDRLGSYPEIGALQPDLPGIRAYPVGSHRIYYVVEADRVEVIRVLHQRISLRDAD